MLAEDLGPFLKHEFNSYANMIAGEVVPRSKLVLLHHGENMKSI